MARHGHEEIGDTYLLLQLHKSAHFIRQNSLDTPLHRHAHFVRMIDRPNANLLPRFPALLDKVLSGLGHQDGECQAEPFACIPKVFFGNGDGEADMVSAEQREMGEGGNDEEGVPEA